MARLNLFVKGNVDVHDSLIYSRVNGRIQWNGINPVLAQRHPDFLARVRHEPCARWDLTGVEGVEIPADILGRRLDLGTFTPEMQFRSQLLAQPSDVVVLSIQADVMNQLSRHRREGFTFFAAGSDHWAAEDQQWLDDEFTNVGLQAAETSMRRLGSLVEALRARGTPTIIVYNMSSVMPGERILNHRGLEDALSTRIRAFNVALIEAAARLDIAMVDVDSLVARAGADRLKLDPIHYVRDGYRLMATEVVRIMEDRGHLDA
jgi:hypothetical protein